MTELQKDKSNSASVSTVDFEQVNVNWGKSFWVYVCKIIVFKEIAKRLPSKNKIYYHSVFEGIVSKFHNGKNPNSNNLISSQLLSFNVWNS